MFSNRGGVVLSNWSALLDDHTASGQEFFNEVEAAVKERKVPDTKFSRAVFKEGGIASAKREYLRVERGNVAFDVGAAPYGTGYFYSWWLVRLGPAHPILLLLGAALVYMVINGILSGILAALIEEGAIEISAALLFFMPASFFLAVAGVLFLARQGVFGPEDQVLLIPVLGWVYNKVFNPNTYYAHDTATMFQESIARVVNEIIDGQLKTQGRQGLSVEEKKPTMALLANLRL